MSVLVTDGNERATLAVTRALGRKGIKVTVGDVMSRNLSSTSKYCHRSFTYSSPVEKPADFLEEITAEVETNSYDVLIPITDVTTNLVAQAKGKLAEYTLIPMPDKEIIESVSDKSRVLKLALREGIPIPKTYFIKGVNQVKEIAKEVEYPVVIKPRKSRLLTENGWVAGNTEYAYSPEDLVAKYEKSHSLIPLPLIQERILGPGCGVFVLLSNSEVRALFGHRRLREKPPSGGVSVLRESVLLNPMMKEYALRLLKRLNWHGVAMVEFKCDSRDNIPKLMEINGRFWGSLQLAIDSGVNFPYLLYKMALEDDVEPILDYRVGVRTRWLLGDLDQILARLLKRADQLNLPDGHPGRLSAIVEFMRFYKRNMTYEVLSLEDPKPGVYEISEYFRALISNVPRLKGKRLKEGNLTVPMSESRSIVQRVIPQRSFAQDSLPKKSLK